MSNAPFDNDSPFAKDFQDTPKKSNKTCLIVSLIFGGLILACVCCGGGLYFMFHLGMGEIGKQTTALIAENAVIQEHIGEIQSSEVLFMESVQYWSEGGPQNTYFFRLKGTKGSGKLRIYLDENNQLPDVETGELILDDGTVLSLVEDGAHDEDSIDLGEPTADEAAPMVDEQ